MRASTYGAEYARLKRKRQHDRPLPEPCCPAELYQHRHARRFFARLRARPDVRRPAQTLVRHEFSRYDIPNEVLQQQAGQRQNADNFETMGTVSCSTSSLPTRSPSSRHGAGPPRMTSTPTPIPPPIEFSSTTGFARATPKAASPSSWRQRMEGRHRVRQHFSA